jgi:Family of unknown function (DUF6079)
MRRIQEKIKDMVDFRPYHSLRNFISNPSETLTAYHFTDATAELMGKWIDAVSGIQGNNGLAKALAGYRGVGKSHLIATFGAILSNPELRSRITDSHVSTSVQRLKQRKFFVGYVQRGTEVTLLEEFKKGIADTLGFPPDNLSDSVEEILVYAAQQANDLPFVLLIDTSQEREKRVIRDDGPLLGKIAETAKRLNIFAVIALDDDIAGADGANASISQSYAIEYLDQEHLYRIVDTHIFPKQRQRQSILHEVYANFREVLPSFRWSEQRFSAVYPLHPIVLDIAPFIRLYAPEFVILGFAAESGGKNSSRPANSLIALDEVFDRVEVTLRKSEFLQEMFATYDKINAQVIGQIPIMQRLQAKMVLKALTLLSLDGDGTTANEIAAAMLIYDENDPPKAIKSVETLLQQFAFEFPEELGCQVEQGRETRFKLKLTAKDSLNDELTKLAGSVDETAIQKVLQRTAREIFNDWTFSNENGQTNFETVEGSLVWRGGVRHGKLIWKWGNSGEEVNFALGNTANISDFCDWEVVIKEPNADISDETAANEIIPTVVWSPAEFTPEEAQTLQRYSVLLNNTSLSETFGEQARTAAHSHASVVKKIWKRIFIEDGKMIVDGQQRGFLRDSHDFESLSEMFSLMLAPLFDTRYPNHPKFESTLAMNEVSKIVGELFSGKNQPSADVLQLAEKFALPLGLVSLQNNVYALANDEQILQPEWSQRLNSLITNEETVPLRRIYRELKKAPLGLVKEYQNLIFAAFAANHKLEFVTANGDRIGKRSLDLKIIWDEIVSVARPKNAAQNSAELTNWAKIITNSDDFMSVENDESLIKSLLKNWSENWNKLRISERFNALPDEVLNNKIWKISSRNHKLFNTVATAIEGVNAETLTLCEGLQRVADTFANSPIEYFNAKKELEELELFINNAAKYTEFWSYLALTEITNKPEIEQLREKLLRINEDCTFNFHINPETLCEEFRDQYTAHFAELHDNTMRSHEIREKIDEILQSSEWWEFENLSRIPIFHQNYRKQTQKLLKQTGELACNFDVREMLRTKPFCACSFQMSNAKTWENLPSRLNETIKLGRTSYRRTLRFLAQNLVPLLENFAEQEKNTEFAECAKKLSIIFRQNAEIPLLNNVDLQVLSKIITLLPNSIILQTKPPEMTSFATREEVRQNFNQWFDTLPSDPILLKV